MFNLSKLYLPWRTLFLSALLVLLGLGSSGPGQAAGISVNEVRIGKHPDKTRFVIELGAKPDFKVFTLADPYRVVVDLPEVEWHAAERVKMPKGALIENFRYGLFKPGNFRIVLDVSRPVEIQRSFTLPPGAGIGHRLVIDLNAVDRATFMKRAEIRPPRVTPKAMPERRVVPLAAAPKARGAKKIIVLDAGHGGVDPGTTGVSGRREKDLTLAFAKELAKALRRMGGFKVVLTRERDIFVRLRDRVRRGRAADADLFISIHADSIDNRKVRGATVYTLSENSSDREAAALARKENKADIIAGVDLSGESDDVTSILIDLAQRESMNYSAIFANMLVPELARNAIVRKNTHRFAGFVVLKAPDVPSVLLELGYLSNARDEKMLSSPRRRGKLVTAVAKSVQKYFQTN